MSTRFDDRFRSLPTDEDALACFRLDMDPRIERREPIEVYLAERLYFRLYHLGAAFQLPLLARFPLQGSFSIPVEQFDRLSEELAFIGSAVNDPLLLHSLIAVGDLLRPRGTSSYGWRLSVEAP